MYLLHRETLNNIFPINQSKERNNIHKKLCKNTFGAGRFLVSTNTAVNGFFNNSVPRGNREPLAKSAARSGKRHTRVTAKETL